MYDHKYELEYENESVTRFLGLDITNTGSGNDNTIKFTMNNKMYCLLLLIGIILIFNF